MESAGDAIRNRSASRRLNDSQQLIVLLGVVTLLVLGGTRLGIALWPDLAASAAGTAAGTAAQETGSTPGDAGTSSGALAGGIVRALLDRYECPLRRTTGIACPTCGGTRAIISLVAGHPLRAVVWNPLVTLAAAGLPALALLALIDPRASARLLGALRRRVVTWWGRALIAGAVVAQVAHATLLLR